MNAVTLLLSLSFATNLPVTVTGPGDCGLAERAQSLLASFDDGHVRHVQVALEASGGMAVELRGAEGVLLAAKRWAEPFACEDRAQVVAVFASTWAVAGGLGAPLDEVAVALPAPRPEPAAAPVLTAIATPAKSPPPGPRMRWAAGLVGVAGAAFEQGSTGIGFVADVLRFVGPTFALKGEVFGVPGRRLAIENTQVSWNRFGGGLEAASRKSVGAGAWGVDAGVLVAHTRLEGRSGTETRSDAAWVPAGKLALVGMLPLGAPLSVVADLDLVVWAREERVWLPSTPERSPPLPRADLWLRVTVAWDL